jgi:hypothetical protein
MRYDFGFEKATESREKWEMRDERREKIEERRERSDFYVEGGM